MERVERVMLVQSEEIDGDLCDIERKRSERKRTYLVCIFNLWSMFTRWRRTWKTIVDLGDVSDEFGEHIFLYKEVHHLISVKEKEGGRKGKEEEGRGRKHKREAVRLDIHLHLQFLYFTKTSRFFAMGRWTWKPYLWCDGRLLEANHFRD